MGRSDLSAREAQQGDCRIPSSHLQIKGEQVAVGDRLFCILLQVLQNNGKYQVVPKKLTIGKRLAQCLHPALPSGVHRKALETYEIIFKIIGPKRLAKDLFLYR